MEHWFKYSYHLLQGIANKTPVTATKKKHGDDGRLIQIPTGNVDFYSRYSVFVRMGPHGISAKIKDMKTRAMFHDAYISSTCWNMKSSMNYHMRIKFQNLRRLFVYWILKWLFLRWQIHDTYIYSTKTHLFGTCSTKTTLTLNIHVYHQISMIPPPSEVIRK